VTGLSSAAWRELSRDLRARRAPTGLDAVWAHASAAARQIAPKRGRFLRFAENVLRLETEVATLADARLNDQLDDLRAVFRLGRESGEHRVRAYALVREAAQRELGMRPFRVQVAGARALESGCVVEMATGEGKTLTATIPGVVAGWRGRGCHIITVNDYLAARDAEWMSPLYRRCGLTVGAVVGHTPAEQRRAAYHADVTYSTNKEVAADFLRDRLAIARAGGAFGARLAVASGSPPPLLQRGLERAIVDEADSVLIDEAVTPLILSAQSGEASDEADVFREAAELARGFERGAHFRLDPSRREIDLTRAGRLRLIEHCERVGGVWRGFRRAEELLVQALTARELHERDRSYVVRDGKVVIIDEFTGRLMPDRSWRDGLHQAVEAKEGSPITTGKETQARISFQRFFRLYRSLSGMTGTASEASRELWRTYRLPVVVLPTNRPVQRRIAPDRAFPTADEKWGAVVEEIERTHRDGRPVLIGTRSVEASEHLSRRLGERGLEHEVLNAVRHEEEARIIEGAGQAGRITVATNMAGRGADIRLGSGVAEKGGLHVVATERHASGRVDRQLFGRAGRQGDPGSGVAYLSREDDLLERFAPRARRIAALKALPAVARLAQRRAERLAARRRASVLRADDWLDDALGFAGKPF